MDFQTIIDSLTALEAAADALKTADDLKTKNDDKFTAAQQAKDASDKADVDAATSVNDSLDAFGKIVSDFVLASKVSR